MTNFTMLVHNRPRLTKQALDSMGDIGHSLVLFDNPSDKDTDAVLDQWSDRNLRPGNGVWRVPVSKGTGWSRNEIIRMSEKCYGRGDYLYLSDNDVFFKPGWLETLVKAYEVASEYDYKVIGAYGHPYHQPIPGEPWIKVGEHMVQPVHAIALQSMLMTWDTWDKFGPFKETPPGRVCMGEDVDFSQAITKAGYKLGVVSPALLVNCGITNSFGEKIPGWEMVQKECPEGVLCE